jgi:hypothetical protein
MDPPPLRYPRTSPSQHLIKPQLTGQRSDTLRYLLLLVEGGIYSDTDTRLRKPPSRWGQGATLWSEGKGLKKEEKARIAAGEKWEEVLGPPSVVIGIEADVGERDDWNEWWPRPVIQVWHHRIVTRLHILESL